MTKFSNIKISVVTVCLNSERTIEKCLSSVKNQTYKNWQHIVIDGDSVDDTKRIVNKFSPHVFMVSEPDEGIYDAMNKSFKWVAGDYILFLNSDDYLASADILERVVESMNIFPADIYYGNIFQRADEGIIGKFCPPGEGDLLEALSVYCLPHQAMFSSRKIFDVIGLFNRKYKLLSDYDWYTRALASDYSLKYLDLDISVYYMGGASSDTALRLKEFYEIQNSSPLFIDSKIDYLRLFMVLQKINYFESLLKKDGRFNFSSECILDGLSPRDNLYHLQSYLTKLEMCS